MKTKKYLHTSISDEEDFIIIKVWKKLEKVINYKENLLKKELDYDEINEDTWEERENEW